MEPIAAGIRLEANGLAQSINAMQLDMNIMGIFGENVVGFDKIGYQRKEAVVSSFAEYIGSNALSAVADTQVGRIFMSERPLDVALSEKGHFQILNKDGNIELTRDGRFKLDKDGNLLTQEDAKVLSITGLPIKLPFVPSSLDKIKIGVDGKIGVFDENKRDYVEAGTLGVVNDEGAFVATNCVRQGYLESSNVQLEREYMEMVNYKRSFEANRQMFKLQNTKLSNAISRLSQV